VQDVAFHRCGEDEAGCGVLLLPRQGKHLVSCHMPGQGKSAARAGTGAVENKSGKMHESLAQMDSVALPLHQAWLDDRGGAALTFSPHEDHASEDIPEEISAVAIIPCVANAGGQCLAVGTTARRVVELVAKPIGGPAALLTWVPRRILSNDIGEVPGPGAFALLGERYLSVLLRGSGELSVLDLENGGSHTAHRLQLPKQRLWSSVCSGGGNIFALEHGDDPSLWRFSAPADLSSRASVDRGGAVLPFAAGEDAASMLQTSLEMLQTSLDTTSRVNTDSTTQDAMMDGLDTLEDEAPVSTVSLLQTDFTVPGLARNIIEL